MRIFSNLLSKCLRLVLGVAVLAALGGCDSKTLQGLLERSQKLAEKKLPANGEGTADLAKMRGTRYKLRSVEVMAWSAEFKSFALFTHELEVPGILKIDRDTFDGRGQWAPEDTTQKISVDLCIPPELDLTGARPRAGSCINYRPSIASAKATLDIWKAERGIDLFGVFVVGKQNKDFYTLAGENQHTATARELPEGGFQILEEIERPTAPGKPFLGEVKKYYIELNYSPQ